MRTFNSLIKDLDEGEGTKIVFDIDKYKKALKNPPLSIKVLNFQVLVYLCFRVPLNERIPPLEQIARDLDLEIKIVKEAIAGLKHYGALSED